MHNYLIFKIMAVPPDFYNQSSHQIYHIMTSPHVTNIQPLHPCLVSCSTCLVLVMTSLNSSVRALPPDPAMVTAAAWRGGFGGNATAPGAMPAERCRTWPNTTWRDVMHHGGTINDADHVWDDLYFVPVLKFSSLQRKWSKPTSSNGCHGQRPPPNQTQPSQSCNNYHSQEWTAHSTSP